MPSLLTIRFTSVIIRLFQSIGTNFKELNPNNQQIHQGTQNVHIPNYRRHHSMMISYVHLHNKIATYRLIIMSIQNLCQNYFKK